MHLSAHVLPLLTMAAEKPPKASDVKAGWVALGVFALLILGLILLMVSMVRRLRNAQAAKDAGVYGDAPVSEGESEEAPDEESGAVTEETSDERPGETSEETGDDPPRV